MDRPAKSETFLKIKEERPKYYLRQGSAYLHKSGTLLTGNPAHAWAGGAEEALECCDRLPLAKHMCMEVIA